MAKIPELKTGQMVTLAYFIGIIIILFVVYKVLAKFGIIKTAAAKAQEAKEAASVNEIRTGDFFDPEYWKTKSGFNKLGAEQAAEYASDIYGSIYWRINTNSEKIFSTFGKLTNKTQISEIADQYKQKYDRDLQASLLNNLNEGHIAELTDIINLLQN